MKLHIPVKLLQVILSIQAATFAVYVSHADTVSVPTGYTGVTIENIAAKGQDTEHENLALILTEDATISYSVEYKDGELAETGTYTITSGETTITDKGVQTVALIVGDHLYISSSNNNNLTFSGSTTSLSFTAPETGLETPAVKIEELNELTFSSNVTHYGYGGAVDTYGIEINNCTNVNFESNGAIYHKNLRPGDENKSGSCGGAIYLNNKSDATFTDNTNISFKDNYILCEEKELEAGPTYDVNGGAIGGTDSAISFTGNGAVSFSGNTVKSSIDALGGAIFTYNDPAEIKDKTAAEIIAATGYKAATVSFNNNASVSFENNSTTSTTNFACGGAIYTFSGGLGTAHVEVKENTGNVTFSGNKANAGVAPTDSDEANTYREKFLTQEKVMLDAEGGAVRADSVIISQNKESITITENEAQTQEGSSLGGAFSGGGGNVELTYNTGNITVERNKAQTQTADTALGGAFFAAEAPDDIKSGDEREGKVIISYNGIKSNNSDTSTAINIIINDNYVASGEYAHSGSATNADLSELTLAAGGAICGITGVELEENYANIIQFTGNKVETMGTATSKQIAYAAGGAIAAAGAITFQNNNITGNTSYTVSANDNPSGQVELELKGIVFYNNQAYAAKGQAIGGALTSESSQFNNAANLTSIITFSNNQSDINFLKNAAESGGSMAAGGAMFSGGNVVWEKNGNSYFGYNHAKTLNSEGINVVGGAITAMGTVSFSSNTGKLTFDNNYAELSNAAAAAAAVLGGAIYGEENVTFTGNTKSILFTENSAKSTATNIYGDDVAPSTGAAYGGAIASQGSVNFNQNTGTVSFTNNTASGVSSAGGAIFGGTALTMSGNTSLSFSNNTASATTGTASGGALVSLGSVTLSGNGGIIFSGNSANSTGNIASGGAISAPGADISNTHIAGSVTLSYNTGTITFTENSVTGGQGGLGGAIYTDGNVYIQHNEGSISFNNNSANIGYGGAIYASGLIIANNGNVSFENNTDANGLRSVHINGKGAVELAAAEGKTIAFKDSVYVGGGTEAPALKINRYTDTEGNTATTTGKVIFNGEAKGAGKNEIYRHVEVHGGSMVVEKGASINMQEKETSYNLNVKSGAELSLDDSSSISAGVVSFEAGSTYSVHALKDNAGLAFTDVAPAVLTGSSVVLNDGMNYLQYGTFTSVQGAELVLNANKNEAYSFQVDYSTAVPHTVPGDSRTHLCFILFTGAKDLTLNIEGVESAISISNLNKSYFNENGVINLTEWYEEFGLDYTLLNISNPEDTYLGYHKDTGTLFIHIIPEPSTATLSLLALTALATRRRRRQQ